MKVALIYPKLHGYNERPFGMGGYADIMSGYPPLSLAYVAAIIKKAGHQVIIIDGNILNLRLGEIIRILKDFSPDLLGFNVSTTTFHSVSSWIREIKKVTGIPVIVGGALLDLYPKEVMQHKGIDYALTGSGLDSLPRFLQNFSGKFGLKNVPGLLWRLEDTLIVNQREIPQSYVEGAVFPARELLPNHKYYSPFSTKKNFTTLVTSRGCLFNCAYCCLPGKVQLRDCADVISEMEECKNRYGIRDIDIYDTNFCADRSRAISLCRKIREKKLDFSWITRVNVHSVDKELLEEMAASGCRMIMYGIESTDEDILKNLNRPFIPVERIKEAIKLTAKVGITSFGFFMLGAPGETHSSMKKTIRFSRQSGLDFVQFLKLNIIPGTRLYNEYLNSHRDDYWSNFILGRSNDLNFPCAGSLPHDAVMCYVRKGNLGFYLNPCRIGRILVKIRSPRQLINYIKAGWIMLISYLKQKI